MRLTLPIVVLLFQGLAGTVVHPTEDQKTASSSQQANTKASEVIVQPKPAPKEPTADDRIASYTGWLTVFTAVLAVGTLGLLWLARAQGKQIEREFLATHRPKLRIRQVALNPAPVGDETAIEAVIANVGDSPATIVDVIAADWDGEIGVTQPSVRDKVKRTEASVSQRVLKSGESALLRHKSGFLDYRFSKRVAARDLVPMMFLCIVRYTDNLGTERRTSFFGWLNEGPPVTRFLQVNYETDHNYED